MIKLKNNMLKSKRSQMHVEMIISFIIFVGFIFTILYFINPVKEIKISTLKLNFVQEKVLNNVSLNYQTSSLILKDGLVILGDCFWVNNKLETSGNLITFDSSGVSRSSTSNLDKIYVDRVEGERIYHLYFSDNFDENIPSNLGSCVQVADSNFSFGNLNNEKRVFYPFLESLNTSFILNYVQLRDSLQISDNFDFIVRDLNGVIIFDDSTQLKTLTSNVLAREIPLNVLDSDASTRDFVLNLRVW